MQETKITCILLICFYHASLLVNYHHISYHLRRAWCEDSGLVIDQLCVIGDTLVDYT